VAGYGTDIEVPETYDSLVRALLRAAQRRARAIELEMHYRREGARNGLARWYITIDGNGFWIAAWAQQIERDLPIVAEGYTEISSTALARRIATSMVARFVNWSVGDEEVEESPRVVTSRLDHVKYRWSVVDIPEPDHRLGPRLWLADEVIARWMTSDMPEEIAIEEMHTAAEGALRYLLKAGHSTRWPTLLLQAVAAGLLDYQAAATFAEFNSQYRNRLKHRTEAIPDDERDEVREAMHRLLERLIRLLERMEAGDTITSDLSAPGTPFPAARLPGQSR
jgi:hypothetical protein